MNNINRRSKGRPIQDREKKSHSRVIRFEPYMDERLTYTCRVLGISMSYYSQSKRYSNVSEYVIMETVMRNEAFSDNRS